MKTITKGKMWCFAIGQFGWSLLSALITNWLVYFYQPDADSIAAGQTLFIPQGRVILGIATVIGGIAALGRVFDAVILSCRRSRFLLHSSQLLFSGRR